MALECGAGPLASGLRCARSRSSQWVLPFRSFSTTTAARLESDVHSSMNAPTPPPFSQSSSEVSHADPNTVSTPRAERRLLRLQNVNPISSRRRRAALAHAGQLPFSELPYQCFQEARAFLQKDREEKLEMIRQQKERIKRLQATTVPPQDEDRKERRLASMHQTLQEDIILADINDPLVKKRFEDGLADMSKPIYRHLANQKWRSYKRKLLMQRVEQMNVIPDVFPVVDPIVSTTIRFGKKVVQHGDVVATLTSEKAPIIDIQSYDKGEKLVTIAVVNADVPDVSKDGYNFRCHFLASNIKISPTQTRVDLGKLDQQTQVIHDWLPPYCQKGIAYQRLAVFIMQQTPPKKPLATPTHDVDVSAVKNAGRYAQRDGFILRSFASTQQIVPIGVDLFRTKWDEDTTEVMKRAGVIGWDVEFKRKRIEPLPYKRLKTDRYR